MIIPIDGEEPEILTLVDRVGVNHAKTYTCFCNTHDDEVFAPIEKDAVPFDKKNPEQCYLYAYKAFIFEYYKKLTERKGIQLTVSDKPSILKERQYVDYYRSNCLTLKEMEPILQFFNNGIMTRDYSGLKTVVVEFPYQLKFANFACIALDFDLMGKKIKNKTHGFFNRLIITIFPEESKSYMIVSCLESDYDCYRIFFEQLKTTPLNKIKYYLDLVLPLYSENIVINPRLWEKWDTERQIACNFYINRKGAQFLLFRQIIKYGLLNIRKATTDFSDGNRGKIDLFE